MKKILVTLTAFMFLLFSLFVNLNTTSAIGSQDQSCMILSGESDGIYTQINRAETYRLNQTFKPTMNRFTGAKIFVNGDGKGQVHIDLYHGNNFVARSDTQNEPSGWGVVTTNFPETVVTPGDGTYKLIPRLEAGNSSLLWYFKSLCYNDGDAYKGNTPFTFYETPIYDFGFATYGRSVAGETAPAQETSSPPNPTTQNTQTDSSSQSINLGVAGETPREPSKDIIPPKNLLASSGVETITLKWQPSTTQEVDGYKIFRSEKETADFRSLGEVGESTYEFKDAGIEKYKTYYYYVRATMGTDKESASSNTVSASVGKKISPPCCSEKDNDLWNTYLSLQLWQQVAFASGILVVLLLLGILIYRIIKRHKNNKKGKEKK